MDWIINLFTNTESIAHIANDRISIDLDDGVKVNYQKVQISKDGKKYDILAKI